MRNGMKRRMERTDSRGLRTLTNKSTTMPNVLKASEYLKSKQKQQVKLEGILFSPEQSPEAKRKNESQLSLSPDAVSSSAFSTGSSSTVGSSNDSPFQSFYDESYQIPIPNKPSKNNNLPPLSLNTNHPLFTAKINSSTEKKNNKQTRNNKKRLNSESSQNILTTTPKKLAQKQLRILCRKSKTLLSYQTSAEHSLKNYLYDSKNIGPTSTASNSPSDNIQVTPESLEKKENIFKTNNNNNNSTSEDIKKQQREHAFYKSLQPRRLLEWSESKNDYLTLQNYMSSLKVRKHKVKLNPDSLNRHSELEPRMRSILFDWLMEVCDCFGLQRSTFYMAQYYVDAYLGKTGVENKKKNNNNSQEVSNQSTPSLSSPNSEISMESPLLSAISTVSAPNNEPQNETTTPLEHNESATISKQPSSEVGKLRLQLLGITALFLAAKIEEIDPPRLSRFSYITDGACTDEDIQIQELDLLQTLNWIMNPVTVYDWLRLYLQTTYHYLVKQKKQSGEASPRVTRSKKKNNNKDNQNDKDSSSLSSSLCTMEVSKSYIEDVGFNELVFVQMCQLLDIAILDINSLKWQPWELAASILYHFSSQNTAKRASNVNMSKLVECVSWLTPMALTLKEAGLESKPSEYSKNEDQPRNYRHVPPKQWYNMQTHNADTLSLLESVYVKRDEAARSGNSSNTESD